jgi:very-short-patch-repair endonuclease
MSDFVVRGQKVADAKVHLARQMRRRMTAAESILWEWLRSSQTGIHFRRQQVIDGFVADFYCHSAQLVVEADGPIHDAAYDEERDLIFQSRGITVLRFKNDEIINQTSRVLAQIKQTASSRLK